MAGKKRAGFFGFKTFIVLLVLLAAGALFLYVRSGGTLKELGRFLPSELRLEPPASKPQGSWEASIFFGDPDTDLLIAEKRTLTWDKDPEKRAYLLMTELLRGPQVLPCAQPRTQPCCARFQSRLMVWPMLISAHSSPASIPAAAPRNC